METSLRVGTRPGRFRIGATSFVYPADWATNVERLGGRVDDVELLFFEAGKHPDATECARLLRAKMAYGLSFSLHAPLGLRLASDDRHARGRSVADALSAIHAARPLGPTCVVVHVEPAPGETDAGFSHAVESLHDIVKAAAPVRVLVETLDADGVGLERIVERADIGLALDIGHYLRDRVDVVAAVRRLLPLAQVIQWHGVSDRDHRSLEHFPDAAGRQIVRLLLDADYDGVVTLEVFRQHDFEQSLQVMSRWLAEAGGEV